MSDFLLEIGLEEVPARMIAGAEAELGRRVGELLTRERLLGIPITPLAGGQHLRAGHIQFRRHRVGLAWMNLPPPRHHRSVGLLPRISGHRPDKCRACR